MVLMVVLAFAVCWTPYFLVSIITQYQAVNFMEKENFFFTMLNINLFAFLNSCVNPFIYAAMSTRFRNGFLRCFTKFLCCGSSPEGANEQEMVVDRTKRVRFTCQPTCLIAHSSSDGGGSVVASDTSQRTAYTVDGRRNGGSILRTLGKGRPCTPSHKIIARYIKKGSSIHFGDKNSTQENRLTALAETTRTLHRRCSSSTGDVSSLVSMPCCEDSAICLRKCSSCLTVNNKDGCMA